MTQKQSETDRISYRSQIARLLAEFVDGNVQILSREQIATFGNSEWSIIQRLEISDSGCILIDIDSEAHTAAQNLAEYSIVNIEQHDDEMCQVTRKFSHTIATIFES